MKADEKHILAPTVLRDLEQVDDALEPRRSRQLWSDVRERDGQDRIHFDLTIVHAVPAPDLHMGAHPDPEAASDLAAAHSVAQSLGKDHLDAIFSSDPAGCSPSPGIDAG